MGVRGEHQNTAQSLPLTLNPSPGSTGERGAGAATHDRAVRLPLAEPVPAQRRRAFRPQSSSAPALRQPRLGGPRRLTARGGARPPLPPRTACIACRCPVRRPGSRPLSAAGSAARRVGACPSLAAVARRRTLVGRGVFPSLSGSRAAGGAGPCAAGGVAGYSCPIPTAAREAGSIARACRPALC